VLLYRKFFSGEVEVVNCSYIAGRLWCFVCFAEWLNNDMRVLCSLVWFISRVANLSSTGID